MSIIIIIIIQDLEVYLLSHKVLLACRYRNIIMARRKEQLSYCKHQKQHSHRCNLAEILEIFGLKTPLHVYVLDQHKYIYN